MVPKTRQASIVLNGKDALRQVLNISKLVQVPSELML
jgi:hypothetical protein